MRKLGGFAALQQKFGEVTAYFSREFGEGFSEDFDRIVLNLAKSQLILADNLAKVLVKILAEQH